jgi:hypothetical protein
MRFDLRPSAKAVAFGACSAVCFAAQNRAEAGDARAGRQRADPYAASATASTDWRKSPRRGICWAESGLPDRAAAGVLGRNRENEMMSVVAQNLSPTDIQNLAAYYSVIEISLGKPPLTRA